MASTFHNFARLPSELRIKIWKYLLPGERIVPVQFDSEAQRYVSDTAPHSLLQTNRESRSIYLERYSVLRLSPQYESTVYIDFACDTLFLHDFDCSPDGDLGWDLVRSPDRHRIQRIAIDSCLWDLLRAFKADELSELSALPNLKTIALVLQPDRRADHDDWTGLLRGIDDWRDEIRHVNFYVALLTSALAQSTDLVWSQGAPPAVTMWLCRDFKSSSWRAGMGLG